MMKWIRCDERLPEKEGVYLVTVLNREWKTDKSGIEEGLKPPHDKYWEQHKDLYGQLPDGRWVKTEQLVFHDGIWSGYMETVLAWMQMPRPYGVERQLSLTEEDADGIVRCQDCKYYQKVYGGVPLGEVGHCICHSFETVPDWFCADGERREEDERRANSNH